MTSDFIRVPHERIAVLIGSRGKAKKSFEKLGNCKISIQSTTGEIEVIGEDALGVRRTLMAIKAVGRGFSPEKAKALFDTDYFFEMIEIKKFTGKSDKAMKTKKARLIGRQGSIRNLIEEKTNCFVSVYGKTVGIIGKMSEIDMALKALEMILEGAEITTIKKFLDRNVSIKKFNVS